MSLGHRILLRNVSPRRFRHHAEFIEAHHGIVPDLELEPRLLLELAQEVRLLLHEVQRHLGVEPHRELALPVLGTGALQGTLHPPHHHLGPEHTSRAVAGRALDRKSTRLNSSHLGISYAVFCLKKKTKLMLI